MLKESRIVSILVILTVLIFGGCGDDSGSPSGGGTPDTEAPQLLGATVEDSAPHDIVLVFDEEVVATSHAGFSLTLNAIGVTLSGLSGSGTTELTLTLPHPVLYPHELTIQYEAATGNVTDDATAPNALASFASIPVTNNVTNKIETIAGGNGEGYTGDGGAATSAQFDEPWAVLVVGSDIYVADHRNTVIRKFSVGGNISTILDHPYIGRPNDLWISGSWIYVAGNVHCVCRFQDGGTFERIGGTAYTPGFAGDGGDALLAEMNNANGMWTDGVDVYIADTFNNRVRKFPIGGNMSTVAGDGSYYGAPGDGGPATSASVTRPISVRKEGATVFVSTAPGPIRTFTDGGNIDSLVPTGVGQAFGFQIHDGYIYIADSGDNAIKRVSVAGGTVETIAGGNGGGYTGDGGAAISAQLDYPYGLYVDGGYIYIADTRNHAIRRIHLPR